jgi:hypothetical protein
VGLERGSRLSSILEEGGNGIYEKDKAAILNILTLLLKYQDMNSSFLEEEMKIWNKRLAAYQKHGNKLKNIKASQVILDCLERSGEKYVRKSPLSSEDPCSLLKDYKSRLIILMLLHQHVLHSSELRRILMSLLSFEISMKWSLSGWYVWNDHSRDLPPCHDDIVEAVRAKDEEVLLSIYTTILVARELVGNKVDQDNHQNQWMARPWNYHATIVIPEIYSFLATVISASSQIHQSDDNLQICLREILTSIRSPSDDLVRPQMNDLILLDAYLNQYLRKEFWSEDSAYLPWRRDMRKYMKLNVEEEERNQMRCLACLDTNLRVSID